MRPFDKAAMLFAATISILVAGCASGPDADARGMSFDEFHRYQQIAAFADAGGDLDRPDSEGVTPLNDALRRHYVRLAQYLLSRGARINAPDRSGCTPLHTAVSSGDLELAKDLLRRGADPNALAGVVTPIALATGRKDLAMVRVLAEYHADPNLAPLQNSLSCGGSEEAFGYSDPADEGPLPKERTMNLKALGWPASCLAPPLANSVNWGEIDLAEALLKAGARFRFGGWERVQPALFLAVHARNVEMVNFLLSRGADPNEPLRILKNKESMTSLHVVAAAGDLSLVQLLVGKGAAVNAKDNDGETPIQYAERGSVSKVVNIEEKVFVVQVPGEPLQVQRQGNPGPDPAHQAVIDYLRAHGAK